MALTAKATSASTVAGDPGNTLVTKDYLAAGNLAVTTDATLTGDGTTGNPLGIDVANANTWTATQTLPATAAQGDALIASTNSGTTTINAARIGTGLTDAQVNDNLTINGGTVDATPIGATTPSTGAFTTVDASGKITSASTAGGDPGNTVVTKDYLTTGVLGVSTDATMTGDGTTGSPLGIDLSNANTWTGTQTLPATAAQGDALIASVNSGSTTINDAHVADALTISGGTIDNSPIGATTPSTGAFTTIAGASMSLTGKATSASTVVGDPGNTLVTKDFLGTAGSAAVTTDATLVGDGTTGNALGINLANSNTYTAAQLLPASGTQGDNLIAAVNAGTTTINAVRIGNGLTDAQVNDALTISGGTINNTPIGASTPSTGAFTTINGTSLALTAKATSASTVSGDAGTTLVTKDFVTTAGNVAVSTDATLVGDGTTGNELGLADDAVSTVKIVDNAVTAAKISTSGASTAGQALMYNGVATPIWGNPTPGGTAGGDLTGSYPNPLLSTSAATGARIVTAINASSSTISDARLSSNVALLNGNNTWTGTAAFNSTATFNGVVTMTSDVVLSYSTVAAGATITIPANATVVEVTNDAAAAANAVTMPAGVNGQVLYISNSDTQALTGGATTVSGATEKFIYIGGVWRLVN